MSERGSSDGECGRRGRSGPPDRGAPRRSPKPEPGAEPRRESEEPRRGAPALGVRRGRLSSPPRCVSWATLPSLFYSPSRKGYGDIRCRATSAHLNDKSLKCLRPPTWLGALGLKGCSAVSYFSTRRGSIIGAGRLSFRVRDGTGRFPTAVAAVTLFYLTPHKLFGGGVWSVRFVNMCGCECTMCKMWCYTLVNPIDSFWVCVSFRPVSASSLQPLLAF